MDREQTIFLNFEELKLISTVFDDRPVTIEVLTTGLLISDHDGINECFLKLDIGESKALHHCFTLVLPAPGFWAGEGLDFLAGIEFDIEKEKASFYRLADNESYLRETREVLFIYARKQ